MRESVRMAEHHREPNYMGVWWWLLGLTIAEIVVAVLPLVTLAKGFLLVGMALSKATLVALYFMHLKFERVFLSMIALSPLVVCVFLLLMLLPDLGAVDHRTSVRAEGVGHETTAVVLPGDQGKQLSPSASGEDVMIQRGQSLAAAQGCVACHSSDGSRKIGPTWKGLYNRVETLEDGSTVTVDEAYIRESIREPLAKIVKGYPRVMPPFGHLEDEDVEALIAYIKSLS
jgi:caa(3)-type oxidase subunit IV